MARRQNTTEESGLSKAQRERDEAIRLMMAEKSRREELSKEASQSHVPWWGWLLPVLAILGLLLGWWAFR